MHALNDIVHRTEFCRQAGLTGDWKINSTVRVLTVHHAEGSERGAQEVARLEIRHASVVRNVLHLLDESVRDSARDEHSGNAAGDKSVDVLRAAEGHDELSLRDATNS